MVVYLQRPLAGEIIFVRAKNGEWPTTFCIYAGVGFENRLPSGNAEKKYDYKIIGMIFRTSQAPNQSR